MRNVHCALAAAGAGPEDVTAVTIHLTAMANLRVYWAIRQEELGEMRATSTAVAVSALALPGMLIEVTVTAVRARS